ncbi:hypothetical protein [Streptomyces zinciresistens]|uniref:hypothetical protein n=1 Tax=Streptomyces zinciresistens TaxID=1073330 RepID=UPI00111279E1|nr:hypothetical protein [Streptomyces zinciresistens]
MSVIIVARLTFYQQTPTTNPELTATVPANSIGRLMLGEYPSEEVAQRFTFRISPPSDDGVVVHETFDNIPGGVHKIVFIENYEMHPVADG